MENRNARLVDLVTDLVLEGRLDGETLWRAMGSPPDGRMAELIAGVDQPTAAEENVFLELVRAKDPETRAQELAGDVTR